MAGFLRFGRSFLHQPDRDGDEEEELQVLRLPVLGDVNDKVRRGDEVEPGGGRFTVGRLFVVEDEEARNGLAGEGEQEETSEEDAERVLSNLHVSVPRAERRA